MNLRNRQRGITLVETTIVLLTLSILAGIIVASATPTMRSARITRATGDCAAISQAIQTFDADVVAGMGFDSDGFNGGGVIVNLLVGAGDIPGDVGGNTANWTQATDGTLVDFFDRHLVTNPLNYAVPGVNGWKGAYISGGVTADPWGNRYAANVFYLSDNTAPNGLVDVVVLSAGPDEIIETDFEQDGFAAVGDDIFCTVSANRVP
jgi:type II secretory pathway pseudopilin PulG